MNTRSTTENKKGEISFGSFIPLIKIRRTGNVPELSVGLTGPHKQNIQYILCFLSNKLHVAKFHFVNNTQNINSKFSVLYRRSAMDNIVWRYIVTKESPFSTGSECFSNFMNYVNALKTVFKTSRNM